MSLTASRDKTDKKRPKTEKIRRFILLETEGHEKNIVAHTARRFHISRQAVHKHVKNLIENEVLVKSGSRKSPAYVLRKTQLAHIQFPINSGLAEDVIWVKEIEPTLPSLPENVFAIAHFAFTEIFNNAIDHSEGGTIDVEISSDMVALRILVADNGIGIFRKLKNRFRLDDEKHGIFELAKGRLTTDPARHSGEGIFWTSRMVDWFTISSGHLRFSSHTEASFQDVLFEEEKNTDGTIVRMDILLNSKKNMRRIFERFAPESDNFGFTHTHLPVRLAKTGRENLISRSQAKRFLQRVGIFRDVVVDFSGIKEIGQAFADEIFRVFANAHPEIKITPVEMSPAVKMMVNKALALKKEQLALGGSLPRNI
jgi:anti-sigma regulatory factor (Ser/Thr protein kinase)